MTNLKVSMIKQLLQYSVLTTIPVLITACEKTSQGETKNITADYTQSVDSNSETTSVKPNELDLSLPEEIINSEMNLPDNAEYSERPLPDLIPASAGAARG